MATTETQEIIRSLGELKSETFSTLSALATKIDGINRRLDVSNGRISQHDEAIQELRLQSSETRIGLAQLQADHAGRTANRQRYRIAVFERFLWLVAGIALALVLHVANL